jgi:SAM-dependent methyltransferase
MLYDNPDLHDTLMPPSAEQRNFYLDLARRQGGAVLELACGSGPMILPIAAAGLETVGLDLSAEMLRLLRRDGDYSGRPFVSAAPTQVCQARPVARSLAG